MRDQVLRRLSLVLLLALGLAGACSSTTQPSATPTLAPGQTAQPSAAPAGPESPTPFPSLDTFAPLATPGPSGGSFDPAVILDAELAILNGTDGDLLVAVLVFDPAQGQFSFAGATGIAPYDYESQAVGATTYQVQIFKADSADLLQTSPKPSVLGNLGQCTFAIASGDRYVFAVVNDGAIVTRNGQSPQDGSIMSITDSPLCHAPTPTPAPSSTP